MAHARDDDLRLRHALQPVPAAFDGSGKLAKSRRRGKAYKQAIPAVRSLIVPPGDLIGGDLERADGRGI